MISASAGQALGLDTVSQVALSTAIMAADREIREHADAIASEETEAAQSKLINRDILRVRSIEEIAFERSRRSPTGMMKPNPFV